MASTLTPSEIKSSIIAMTKQCMSSGHWEITLRKDANTALKVEDPPDRKHRMEVEGWLNG